MRVTIAKTEWNSAAEKILIPAAFGEIADIKEQVKSGESELWRVTIAGNKIVVGYVVTRLEVRPGSAILVIVAGAGECGRAVMRIFCNLADEHGWSMRVHSVRRGMGRYLDLYGFTTMETIYKRAGKK